MSPNGKPEHMPDGAAPRGGMARRADNAGVTAENSGVASSLATFMVAKVQPMQPVGLLSFYADRAEFLPTRRSFRARRNPKLETFRNTAITDVRVHRKRSIWAGGLGGPIIEFQCGGRRHRFADMDKAGIPAIVEDIRRTGLSVAE